MFECIPLIFAFECESHLSMEYNPQFGPKHTEVFTVFLIKKSAVA